MNWLATGGHAVLSLCSGYGGLELALQRVLPTSYVGAYCENYGPAQQVLQAHNPRVDVFKDVRDPELLNLKAPIVTFGFPCQDLSVAGNRAGLGGKRSGLFHTCMAVVRAAYPDLVVVENVPRLLRYQDVVDAQFHDAGFETAWVTRRACDAGLPHKRERVFVVAKRPGVHFLGYCEPVHPEPVEPVWPTPTVVDMGWGRSAQEWRDWTEAMRERHSNGNGHGRSLYQLCGEGTLMVMEHLMGLPTGYITGLGLSTAAQRRLLGNGVAPAQGALAIWEGLNELG